MEEVVEGGAEGGALGGVLAFVPGVEEEDAEEESAGFEGGGDSVDVLAAAGGGDGAVAGVFPDEVEAASQGGEVAIGKKVAEEDLGAGFGGEEVAGALHGEGSEVEADGGSGSGLGEGEDILSGAAAWDEDAVGGGVGGEVEEEGGGGGAAVPRGLASEVLVLPVSHGREVGIKKHCTGAGRAHCGWVASPTLDPMIEDKSIRSTLFATGILLLGLVLVGWMLSRRAGARRAAAGAAAASAAAAAPAAVGRPAAAAVMAPTLPLKADGRPVAAYQVLTEVSLENDPGNDGDTFVVKTPQGPQRFCLYFVDTVETDGGQVAAARDMAGYFGFDSEEPLRALGLEARDFSLRLLRASSFRVITRWEKNAEEDAFQAFIYLKDPQEGLINLAQWLVRYGLARIVPCERDQPGGPTAAEFRALLAEEEARSKAESHGAWNRQGH